jgi:MFS family permease
LVEDGSLLAIGAMALLGGSMLPLYSLTIAYTNDWLKAEQILGASATLVTVNGTGAIVGPLAAAALMSIFDVRMFFWALAGALAVIATYLLFRIIARDPLPFDEQHDFVPYPVRAFSVAANLIPRRRSDKTIG